MFGFTYNGVHSSQFGLYYTRSAEDKWFKDAEYDVYDEDVSWRNGGYYYGSKAKKRTFTIKCLFEEIDIATRQKIKQWLKRDTSGELIFDDMPFLYWNVRPGKIPIGNWYLDTNESHSGTVTITFNAYEPFGYLSRKSNNPDSPDDGVEDYCNIISSSEMPPVPSTSSTSFDIYNPGTEECGLTIGIEGTTSNPIRFFNEYNSTFCEIGSLPASSGTKLNINGDTGYVSIIANGLSANGYAYHEKGFVRLEPNSGYFDIDFEYIGINGTTYIFELDGITVKNEMSGSTMTISGITDTYYKIIYVSVSSNRIYCSRDGTSAPPSTGKCSIKTLNHILIQEKINNTWSTPSTLSISSIDVDYAPRVQ